MESYLTIIILLLLSAFFTGMEIAFVSSNKIYLEIEKKQTGFLSAVLKKITVRPAKFIATMLVGGTITLVLYAFCMSSLLIWFAGTESVLSLLLQVAVSALLFLITAQFLPKLFFRMYANNLLKFFAVPAYVFYILLSPVSEFVMWISKTVLKTFFKTEGDLLQLSFTKLELNNYISEQMESVSDTDDVDSEIQIFRNALDFSEVKAREVMVPRTEIAAVDVETPPKEMAGLFTQTGFSKILVYNQSVDDIIGYVHAFELFKKPEALREILIPVVFVPETILIKDALGILIKKRKSIAVIIDEYGGTAGMMTVEDIIEELFGEIQDEHDTDLLVEEKLSENAYRFSSRLEVEYINETHKIALPENEDYETIGGLIVHFAEEIPQKDEVVQIGQFLFRILEVSNTKIELVEVEILKNE